MNQTHNGLSAVIAEMLFKHSVLRTYFFLTNKQYVSNKQQQRTAEPHEKQKFGLGYTFWILWGQWKGKTFVKSEFKCITRPPQNEPLTNPFAFLVILAKF